MKINHYTTIDTLELILMNQTLRFNRLDKVDDKQETELVSQEHWSKFIFVSSWSADEYENHAMWGYPGLNGVMIGLPKFPFKKYKLETKESLNFFSKGNMDCPIPFEQIYNKEWMFIVPPFQHETFGNIIEYFPNPGDYVKPFTKDENGNFHFHLGKELARIKDVAWAYQKEFRYMFCIVPSSSTAFKQWKTTGKFENYLRIGLRNFIIGADMPLQYFDVELGDELDSIEVTLGPDCNSIETKRVKNLLQKYTSNGKMIESRQTGKLQIPIR
ncbi:hypothetical protein [Paraglaciecola chathamensis]|uniref:hypothetical protein n=1 Tax=Paraglaciecola chathamensis TaxID=368405 RepID=UPI0027022234|nr:hypothetical protein [Paraglaciecola chathamensis]MDO6561507.1 hypothetical protein [Paraglaciecola chathamensis]